MRRIFGLIAALGIVWAGLIGPAFAKEAQRVQIADPYIDLRTGPGRGYPKFYVAERHDWIAVLKRRTDWFKVRTDNDKEGWVHRRQLILTLDETGELVNIQDLNAEDYLKREWEAGVMGGDFSGATVFALNLGYQFTRNLSVEGNFSQALGNFSDNLFGSVNLSHQPFPHWRVSPYFTLGFGMIHTKPRATLVQTVDRTDEMVNVGLGARVYLTRRFFFRTEYKSYVVLTGRETNEEIDEWKAGFAVFF